MYLAKIVEFLTFCLECVLIFSKKNKMYSTISKMMDCSSHMHMHTNINQILETFCHSFVLFPATYRVVCILWRGSHHGHILFQPQHSIACCSVERKLLSAHYVSYTALNQLLFCRREATFYTLCFIHSTQPVAALWEGDYFLHIMFHPQHSTNCFSVEGRLLSTRYVSYTELNYLLFCRAH